MRSKDGGRSPPSDFAASSFPRRRGAHRAPVLASSILLQTTSKRALRRGGTPSVTASPCHLPQRGRQGRCGAGSGRSMSAPTALDESRCGIRGAMHPQGVCRIRKAPSSPTAALWASRPTQNLSLSATSIPSCVGRAHLSPPLLAFSYSRTPIRKLRRGRCPHRPVLASSILLQTTSKRALRRGGTPSVTASPCRLPQGGRQGRCCAGAGGR